MGDDGRETLNIGVIGVGLIGKRHVKKYAEVAGANVVAVADINETEAQSVAREFAVPHFYKDFRELLARPDIDAVDVCLHNNLHMPVTIAAMEAGKDVLCEKPIAGSYRDGLAMVETARKLGRRLAVQLNGGVFARETRAAKELIDAGMLGEIYHARSTGYRRRGRPFVDGYATPAFVQKQTSAGGALIDMGIYHLAQVLYLMGNPTPRRITGKAYQKTAMDEARRAASGYDVEELGVGFVHFDGDVTLDVIEAWAIHMDAFEGSSIAGTKGGIRLKPFKYLHTAGDMLMTSEVNLDEAQRRWSSVRGDEAYYRTSQDHWVAANLGKVELLPTAEVALNAMLITEGIYRSGELGREVTAKEVMERSASTAVGV